jgi:succinate dehydrogenase / fumarate reductase flavoprotein subunit
MQTEDGEAKRDDSKYMYVSAWECKPAAEPVLHKEPLQYEFVHVATRNYKD